MTRETWFLAVKNEHGGQRRAFLITDQLHGDQVQLLVKALEGQFPTLRILPKRESEIDDVEVLLGREQCRKAEALQRHAPLAGPARRREPLWKREIREIHATAVEMIADIVARVDPAEARASAEQIERLLKPSQDAAAAADDPLPDADKAPRRSKIMPKKRMAELLGISVDQLGRVHGEKITGHVKSFRIDLDQLDGAEREAIENAPPRPKGKPRGRTAKNMASK